MRMNSKFAPIVIFNYARPGHTRALLESLAMNPEVADSDVFIFCDGPKTGCSGVSMKNINLVRKIAKRFDKARKVEVVSRNENFGLARSIITGVTDIINKYNRVIVLEDDLVLSPGFLNFMNQSLEIYENVEGVDHISGYWYPHKWNSKLPETFFYRATSCWGWGTWKKSWEKLELDPVELRNKILRRKEKGKFNINNQYDFFSHLTMNVDGKLNTWAIKWYASVFLTNGLCLHPSHSFVNNVGHDGSGENCGEDLKYVWRDLNPGGSIAKIPVEESSCAIDIVGDFFKPPKVERGIKANIRKLLKFLRGK